MQQEKIFFRERRKKLCSNEEKNYAASEEKNSVASEGKYSEAPKPCKTFFLRHPEDNILHITQSTQFLLIYCPIPYLLPLGKCACVCGGVPKVRQ